MINVKSVKGNVVTVEVTLLDKKDAPLSSSEKNHVVASSGGFTIQPKPGVKMNITAITKAG